MVALPDAPLTTKSPPTTRLVLPPVAVGGIEAAVALPSIKSPLELPGIAGRYPTRLPPYLAVLKLAVVAVMRWLALAPTWKSADVKLPSSKFWPLNWVVCAMRSSSFVSCPTSACSAARSLAELVALADCTASSRIRCKVADALPNAPSATWESEIPSLALRAA